MAFSHAAEVHFEEDGDAQALSALLKPILAADIAQKNVALPENNVITFAKVAKTKDGRLAGGIAGVVMWNAMRVGQLAVNSDCRVPGTGTALMKWAEEAARGQFGCNQMYLATFSWQARPFYEKLGFHLQYTLPDHPPGFAKHFLEKVWTMETRSEPVQGCYDRAATDLVIEDWDPAEAFPQIVRWIEQDTVTRKIDVPVDPVTMHSLRATHPDGSFAGGCVFDRKDNTLFVFTFAVAVDSQRRGIGTALLKKLDAVARKKKCDFVLITTRSWEARPFFEKHGYEVAFTQKDHPVGFETYLLIHKVPKSCDTMVN